MRRNAPQRDERVGERGFTLVEVLIASFLFAVGMVAALAMQYTALGGVASARDLTNATEIGNRVIAVLRAESQQWTGDNLPSTPTYSVGSSKAGHWANSNGLLNQMTSNGFGTWTPVFTNPVDARFSDGGARKFCAYVRGEELNDPNMNDPTGILQVQIAVVYTKPGKTFPGATTSSAGSCADQGTPHSNISSMPSGSGSSGSALDPGNQTQLELKGFRVVHMGTQITQRAYVSGGPKS